MNITQLTSTLGTEQSMNGTKAGRIAVIALLLTISAFGRATAQWTVGSYGVAEYDTKETLLLLAGVNASPKGLGVRPILGLQAYHLGYDAGASRTNVFTVQPQVGLGNNYNGGNVYGSVGYAFTNNDIAGGPVAGATAGEGVVVNGGLDYWGTGGPLGYQAMASYNFGGESFWGRGRVTTRVSQNGQSSSRIGAEVAYLNGTGYSAWQPGGVFEWHTPGGAIIGLGAGAKIVGTGSGGNAAYFRVEGFLPLAR
jgi:hypothetical protein